MVLGRYDFWRIHMIYLAKQDIGTGMIAPYNASETTMGKMAIATTIPPPPPPPPKKKK